MTDVPKPTTLGRNNRALPPGLAVFLALIVVAAIAFACRDDDQVATPSPTPEATLTAMPTTAPAESPAAPPTQPASETPTPLPATTLVFTNGAGDTVELEAEIADDADERGRGLMFRESMPEDHGMIFVYQEDHRGGFFMRNTFIPLSIAFVLADGTIIDIQDMEPETLDTHQPDQQYRYAIEANQGWYEDNGIAAGDTVAIPAEIVN